MSPAEPQDRASVAFAADSERKLILIRLRGWIHAPDLAAAFARPELGEIFDPTMKALTDLRDATLVVPHADMQRFVRSLDDILSSTSGGPPSRGAVIASSDVSFGTSRMYQLLTDDRYPTLRVFRDLEPALDWLGIDDSVYADAESRTVTHELTSSGT